MGGSISQSRFICKVVCTSIQCISAQLWGSICQSTFVCQVLCTGIQGISGVLWGGPLAKVGSFAKCCVLVFRASMLYSWGVHWPKKVHLPGTSLASRWGVHWPKKVHLPSTILASRWGVNWPKNIHLPSTSLASSGGSISQRRFICQLWIHF